MKTFGVGVWCGLLLAATSSVWAAPLRGYHASSPVTAPTRLDAVIPLANQSLAEAPEDWYPGYDSTAQRFELFAPPRYQPNKTYPLILFISPGSGGGNWPRFQALCEQEQVFFACPLGAGNDCPSPKRVRIVLDVLDELRRQYPIDPDRTYLSGFSGGGRIASHLAHALPELCGGLIPICAAEMLREEPWLRHRAIDRLSVALLTGETDFNRGEVERWKGPLYSAVGVRARVWVAPRLGHGIPDARTLGEAYAWLEEGLAKRQQLARTFPAMRTAANVAPTRAEQAQALLNEAQQRLPKADQLYSGLMQLQGIVQRWPDVPAANQARRLLVEYDAKPNRPWEEDDLREQRLFLLAEARTLAAYATGPLDARYEGMRPNMAAAAIQKWELLRQDQPGTPVAAEGDKMLAELVKLVRQL